MGNQNAKKEHPKDGWLHAKVYRADKGYWTLAARAAGLKLVPWIIRELNAAAARSGVERPGAEE